jgi:septal ring factor EnvC (AmiA/AmiB activator)
MKEILEDANVSEGAFTRMARDNYEDPSGYYQQEKERLEGLISAKKEDGEVTEEETEEIADLNSEIRGLNESSKDTTAMIVNTADGVVDLRNKIEDISEILSNEALKGTVE